MTSCVLVIFIGISQELSVFFSTVVSNSSGTTTNVESAGFS